MTRMLFYIIIISQIWLSIGSACAHLIAQDGELIELFGEEEKEKEKELEKEIEKINSSKEFKTIVFQGNTQLINQSSSTKVIGRAHLQNATPPPEYISFL